MRCKALFLAALLVSGAAAADDAPKAIDVTAGQPAPSDGVFLPKDAALAVAKKCAQAEADRDRYRKEVADQPLPSGSLLVGAAVVGLVVGALVGGFAVVMARK
jgi:hypothetical protein